MFRASFELDLVIEAVRHSIPLCTFTLPSEFYPAHLSVALIDAVFRSQGEHDHGTVPAAERYCRWFGIARTRANPRHQPLPDDQETLTNLIGRFDELGMDRMIGEVFRTKQRPPGTEAARVRIVPRAARKLRRVGIEILQDLQAMPCEVVERALGGCKGFSEPTTRLLLTYAANDDFVRGDSHVRQFVASALGRKTVSEARAKGLVRHCAHELILSPRYLDHQIWRHH